MTFTIRLATQDDLPIINNIYNHYVTHSTCTYQLTPSTGGERQQWFDKHPAEFPATVAQTSNGEIIGWASLSPFHPRPGWRFTVEDSIYVHHAHHRKGIGKALLLDLMQRSDALGYRNLVGIISADQAGSIALHRAAGFEEVGRLPHVGFKFDQWLDVVYLQRTNPNFRV